MIKSFKHTGLQAFFQTGNARRLPVENQARVRRMLAALNAATHPNQMNVPGYFWHSLAPGQPSRYSVKVTGNYRLTFAFDGADAADVDLEDYH
jgi:proteic killer suppression protein